MARVWIWTIEERKVSRFLSSNSSTLKTGKGPSDVAIPDRERASPKVKRFILKKFNCFIKPNLKFQMLISEKYTGNRTETTRPELEEQEKIKNPSKIPF